MNLGELYIGKQGQIVRVVLRCDHPTAMVEDVVTGEKTGGALGCRNLSEFRRVAEISPDECLDALLSIAHQCEDLRRKLMERTEELADTKMRLVDIKLKALDARESEPVRKMDVPSEKV